MYVRTELVHTYIAKRAGFSISRKSSTKARGRWLAAPLLAGQGRREARRPSDPGRFNLVVTNLVTATSRE